MEESTEFLYFYTKTLNDLCVSLRVLYPKGYKIRKPQSLSRLLKRGDGYFCMKNPFFHTIMAEVLELDETIAIEKEVLYENPDNFKHTLKMVSVGVGEKCFATI